MHQTHRSSLPVIADLCFLLTSTNTSTLSPLLRTRLTALTRSARIEHMKLIDHDLYDLFYWRLPDLIQEWAKQNDKNNTNANPKPTEDDEPASCGHSVETDSALMIDRCETSIGAVTRVRRRWGRVGQLLSSITTPTTNITTGDGGDPNHSEWRLPSAWSWLPPFRRPPENPTARLEMSAQITTILQSLIHLEHDLRSLSALSEYHLALARHLGSRSRSGADFKITWFLEECGMIPEDKELWESLMHEMGRNELWAGPPAIYGPRVLLKVRY